MNNETCSINKVVSIDDIRKFSAQRSQEESMDKYLGILSFSQLIHETSNAIEQLEKSNFSEETALKSKLVLRELGKRLENQANISQFKDQDSVLQKMKKKLDQRFQNLKPFL